MNPEKTTTTADAVAVFHCPFDAPTDSYVEAYRSYAYNPGPDESEPVPPAKIENPANTIMLAEWYEPDPYAANPYHAVWDGEGWSWRNNGGLYAHHPDGTSGVLFYDLHVENVKQYNVIPAPGVQYKWSFNRGDTVP